MGLPVPSNEAARLTALRELTILDTPAEPVYDDVVRLAATICRTPIAIVNFVDDHRQWGKALIGLDSSEAPREASFCARTIVQPGGVLVVNDTLRDPDWADNAQVVGTPHLRFYAGAAIVSSHGLAYGSVCVADREPRDIGETEIEALRALSRQTAAHLDLRLKTRQLVEASGELRRMALEDALTGLPNRTELFARIEQALLHRRRSDSQTGLLFCDIDGFKTFNDLHGHAAGDDVLREVARRLSLTARAEDTVGRFAGDEFVVLCPHVDSRADLDNIAARLSAAVAETVHLPGGQTVEPTLSIGIGLGTPGEDATSLLRRADAAMYRSKRARSRAKV